MSEVRWSRETAEQIGWRFGCDKKHSLVDAIAHAIEQGIQLGESRASGRISGIPTITPAFDVDIKSRKR